MIRFALPRQPRFAGLQLASLIFAGTLCLQGAAPAVAEESLSFKMTLENDKFTPAEIKVPANKPFVLKVLNGERVAAEIESGDLKFEKVAPSYTEVILRVRPMKPGRYLMYNEYREDVAKAYVVVE